MRIARDDGADVDKAVEDGLTAFNARMVGDFDPLPVRVSVRDDDGSIKGGVVGRVWHDALYISTIWIDDALRGQGHGKTMLALAEDEGRKLGATQSWLHTLSWQARPFYESLGYTCFGEMPMLGGKHHRYFLRKEL